VTELVHKDEELHEALYYEKLGDGSVKCVLCPHYCHLKEDKIGICKGRKNIGGKLIAINYGHPCTIAVDPIEKKPMYHFHPGSEILSTGPNGCNLRCSFCQNWEISQEYTGTMFVKPEMMVEEAQRRGLIGISYTYTEPLIWFEYVKDCSLLARKEGLVNVLVSNGTINPEPFKELSPFIDGINIDLKSMNPGFYKKICGGHLETVLDIIKLSAGKMMLEITNLLITGENDSDEDIVKIVDFIAGVDDEIPLHFSRYSPRYKMKNPPTPVERLFKARDIAMKKLKYVYLGNISDKESSATYCPDCSNIIVKRDWYSAEVVNLQNGNCSKCGKRINIIT
jgi:pyruvate formate lyase activating enzyme